MAYNVLLVDDREETLEVLTLQYQQDYQVGEVFTAQNTQDAIEILKHETIDIASFDIQLGSEDGFQLCLLARSCHPNLFITMCSLDESDYNRRKAESCGASYFLSKPVSVDQITALFVAFKQSSNASQVGNSNADGDWIDDLLSLSDPLSRGEHS